MITKKRKILIRFLNVSLSSLIKDRIKAFPSSGENPSKLDSPKKAVARVYDYYHSKATLIDETNGISMSFLEDEGHWRLGLCSSNTEPVVSLNVESKADKKLMEEKIKETLSLLRK